MLVEATIITIIVITGLFVFLFIVKSPPVIELALKDVLYGSTVIKYNSFISIDDAMLIVQCINSLDETNHLTKQQEILRDSAIKYLEKRGHVASLLIMKVKPTPQLLNRNITLICE